MMREWTLLLLLALVSGLCAEAGTWRDDFEDGDYDGWHRWTRQAVLGSWRVESGELIYAGPLKFHSAVYIGEKDWSNYTVQARVMTPWIPKPLDFDVGLSPQMGVAVGSRLPDGDTYYEFICLEIADFYCLTAGRVKLNQGGMNQLARFSLQAERWYTFRVELDGLRIRTYVDDELIFDFETKPEEPPKGKVALHALAMEAHFDDVIITGPGIPHGGSWVESAHAVESEGKVAVTWAKMKSHER